MIDIGRSVVGIAGVSGDETILRLVVMRLVVRLSSHDGVSVSDILISWLLNRRLALDMSLGDCVLASLLDLDITLSSTVGDI